LKDLTLARLVLLSTIVAAFSVRVAAGSSVFENVPVPGGTAGFARAIFRRPISGAELFGAIISDRRASFVCHALAALDDETLQFFAEHPALLRRVYEHRAGVFAAFGSSIRVSRGRP
jgi:hypothetical protein